MITKDIEYAVKLIEELRVGSSPVGLEYVADKNGLSRHFLEQVARKMRIGGIIQSKRGPGGGYQMRRAGRVSLAELVRLKYASKGFTELEEAALSAIESVQF